MSYFDSRVWEEVVASAERDSRCPRWLVQALPTLARLAPRLSIEEEEPEKWRFDMTYPH